jgi:hypothetical protein
MKRKWEHIICLTIIIVLGVGVFSPVFSQFGGDGAFGSVVDYLKKVASNILPSANNTYALGSATKQWKSANIGVVNATSLNVNGAPVAGFNGVFSTNAVFGDTPYTIVGGANGLRFAPGGEAHPKATASIDNYWTFNTLTLSEYLFLPVDYATNIGGYNQKIYQAYETNGGAKKSIYTTKAKSTGGMDSNVWIWLTRVDSPTSTNLGENNPNPKFILGASNGADAGDISALSMGWRSNANIAQQNYIDFRAYNETLNSSLNATTTELGGTFCFGTNGNETSTVANTSGSVIFGENVDIKKIAKIGTMATNISSVQTSGTYSLAYGTYSTVLVDTTSAAVNATLPTAVGYNGAMFTIKKINSGGSLFTANTTSSQTIDGSTSVNLGGKSSITLQSDNSNWYLI